MTLSVNNQSRVPPGFRFHPTEEELLYYYLKKKVSFEKIDLDVIRDVDLNKLEPWELQERCRIGSTPQNDWYFFSHKDKKYPTGTRTNRATAAGFWKATGRDKPIHTNFKKIGMRKTLVFYKGRAPHGQKTDWIMHEYRLEDTETPQTNNSMGDQQEDGWVVCRVFKKRNHQRGHEPAESKQYGSSNSDFMEKQILIDQDNTNYQDQMSLCKTELIPSMQYGNNFTNDHFMQLPQLESPKMLSPSTTPDQSLSTSGMKRYLQEAFTTNSNTINKRPCYPFDMGEFNPQCTTSTSEYKPQVEETPHVRDWTFVDRLVASHLNQEDPSKDIRSLFSNCNNTTTTNPTTAEQNLIGADTSFPLRMPRINAQDYGCDVDLWNFAK